MNALRIIGIILVSVFLFISLNIFSIALTIDRTVLNPHFVTSQINNLELSILIGDIIREQPDGEITPEMGEALIGSTLALEPEIKAQAGQIIYSSYDYIKGKRDNPEIAVLLRNTLLSNDFVGSLIEEIDIAVIARNVFEEMLSEAVPGGIEYFQELPAIIEQALIENEEYIKYNLINGAGEISDYLLAFLVV